MMTFILILATQVQVTTTLQPEYKNKSLTIGDPFEIEVTITHPIGATVSEPFMDSLGRFMILEQTNKIVQEKGFVNNTYTIRMAAFDTGDLKIPVFKIIQTATDTADTIAGNAVPITIESVMPEDMSDINDLKKAVEFPNFLPLIIAGIVIGAGILGYLAYRVLRRILQARRAPEPLRPPWIEALAAIDTMPFQEWLDKGLIKKYYYALSEIIKRYIERRFAFNAAEQTTSELVTTMKNKNVPLRDDFSAFFTTADLVKYAKVIPPDNELQNALQTARTLVKRTTPQDQEESS